MRKQTKIALLSSVLLFGFGQQVWADEVPTFSANVGITSDYVFRGVSQSDSHVAIQGGLDMSYKFFYAGVWASSLDFADEAGGGTSSDIEVDLYAGIKHNFSGVEMDLGIIYYLYPEANDPSDSEYDFVEFKLGASGDVSDKLSLSATLYYSPEFYGETGEVITVEGGLTYKLGEVQNVSAAFSTLIGYANFSDLSSSSYTYWNAGVEFGLGEKFTLDLRYWDSDIDNNDFADSRFVASLSASF